MPDENIKKDSYEGDAFEREKTLRDGILDLICKSGLPICTVKEILSTCTRYLVATDYQIFGPWPY